MTAFVAGNVKSAMKEAGAGSSDLWNVPYDQLHILPGFNVRLRNDGLTEHVRRIADSIKAEGYYRDKPMAGYVSNEGEHQVIYVTDGHCRYEALQIAIDEGAEIKHVPVVISTKGTSEIDLTVALVKANDGMPLTPYEIAQVCKRLSRFGWSTKQVADRLNYSVQRIDDFLSLLSSPEAVQGMVKAGEVSATVAIDTLKKNGGKATEVLQTAMAKAKAAGDKKVTKKHMPVSDKQKQLVEAAPIMLTALQKVAADPAFDVLSAKLQKNIKELLLVLQ